MLTIPHNAVVKGVNGGDMRCFLVDYENVNSMGLKGLSQLNRDDKVYILYSTNAKTFPLALWNEVQYCQADVKLYEVTHLGQNALDFVLSSLVGYLIGFCRQANQANIEINIISEDTGYTPVCCDFGDLLSSVFNQNVMNIHINCAKSIKDAASQKYYVHDDMSNNSVVDTLNDIVFLPIDVEAEKKEVINVLLESKYKRYASDIVCVLNNFVSLQECHNTLIKMYNKSLGHDIYTVIKKPMQKLIKARGLI